MRLLGWKRQSNGNARGRELEFKDVHFECHGRSIRRGAQSFQRMKDQQAWWNIPSSAEKRGTSLTYSALNTFPDWLECPANDENSLTTVIWAFALIHSQLSSLWMGHCCMLACVCSFTSTARLQSCVDECRLCTTLHPESPRGPFMAFWCYGIADMIIHSLRLLPCYFPSTVTPHSPCWYRNMAQLGWRLWWTNLALWTWKATFCMRSGEGPSPVRGQIWWSCSLINIRS